MEKKSNRGGGGGGGGESTVSWNYLPVRLDPACYLDSFKREMLPNIFPGWEPALVEASPMDLGQLKRRCIEQAFVLEAMAGSSYSQLLL